MDMRRGHIFRNTVCVSNDIYEIQLVTGKKQKTIVYYQNIGNCLRSQRFFSSNKIRLMLIKYQMQIQSCDKT